ncbi:hypothetical protein GWK47_045194 [Chionoecetes opilio]|uniref:Uncharacterized protein n=1 Tax=Chionoecetes opilio TaxID=41210 RepID=A0A8J4Y6I3_CHIOP|nr:hypothetical protein GWK47_045194 [Chionoecetes opilio]
MKKLVEEQAAEAQNTTPKRSSVWSLLKSFVDDVVILLKIQYHLVSLGHGGEDGHHSKFPDDNILLKRTLPDAGAKSGCQLCFFCFNSL